MPPSRPTKHSQGADMPGAPGIQPGARRRPDAWAVGVVTGAAWAAVWHCQGSPLRRRAGSSHEKEKEEALPARLLPPCEHPWQSEARVRSLSNGWRGQNLSSHPPPPQWPRTAWLHSLLSDCPPACVPLLRPPCGSLSLAPLALTQRPVASSLPSVSPHTRRQRTCSLCVSFL